jgi:hypothetical protein
LIEQAYMAEARKVQELIPILEESDLPKLGPWEQTTFHC